MYAMNARSLPVVTRSLSSVPSRRDVVRGLAGAALALGIARWPAPADAKKKNKKPCAKAGQAPKRGSKKGKRKGNTKAKRCCAGLVPNGTGVCAPPPPGCDVCAIGCPFTAVQAAIDAASAGETIRICAGLYPGNLTIAKSLTLIGAGDVNEIGNTILQGTSTTQVVLLIENAPEVALKNLRITGGGGTAKFGGGIRNGGMLELLDCTVTGNRADFGGGIYNQGDLILTDSVITDNMATTGGGIYNAGGTVTLDAASRVTGNDAEPSNADRGGGIYNNGTVTLSSTENVTNNTPDNCSGTTVALCSA